MAHMRRGLTGRTRPYEKQTHALLHRRIPGAGDPSLCRVKSIAFVLSVAGENGIAVLETVDRMVQDTGEVMKYLLEKLDRPKLFLVEKLLPLAEGDAGQAE